MEAIQTRYFIEESFYYFEIVDEYSYQSQMVEDTNNGRVIRHKDDLVE